MGIQPWAFWHHVWGSQTSSLILSLLVGARGKNGGHAFAFFAGVLGAGDVFAPHACCAFWPHEVGAAACGKHEVSLCLRYGP